MKTEALVLVVVLTVSISLSSIYLCHFFLPSNSASPDEFYFGVTCGFNTTLQSTRLIDKVKNYTNLFIIDSWDVAQNETMLNEICDYAAASGLKFIVYFDLISGTSPPYPPTYPWHREWLTSARTRWDEKFLGIYLHDELGGKQLDEQRYVHAASDYKDAADQFVANIASYGSVQFAKNNSIPLFTSDYVLYWWDYLGGYDTMFAELGWNISTPKQIAFGRGAANAQGKDWGAMITWKYDEPPFLADAEEIYSDMLSAYESGAKYVIIFDDGKFPEGNLYGSLTEEHMNAMQNFYTYIKTHPRSVYGETKGTVALVLPANYGWGARWHDEGLWGLWPANEKTPIIWENMNKLLDLYGLELNVVFEDARFNVTGKYARIYSWNATVT